MRQLTFVKKGVLEWREAPEPELRAPEEALVRPFVAARCDGDNLPLFNNAARLLQLGIAIHRIDPSRGTCWAIRRCADRSHSATNASPRSWPAARRFEVWRPATS